MTTLRSHPMEPGISPFFVRLAPRHPPVFWKGENMRQHRLSILLAVAFAATLMLSWQSTFAQLRIVGSISGTVQDPNGAVVPNARVVLKDQQTGMTRESMTTDGGTFLFPDLASGTYQATVSLTGFKTELVPKITVSTSQTTDVRI